MPKKLSMQAILSTGTTRLSPFQAKVLSVSMRHIEHLKETIAHIRETKQFNQTLPHTTTRWLVHRPTARARIQALRLKKKAIRSRIAAMRSS
jgi:hypothetical protein